HIYMDAGRRPAVSVQAKTADELWLPVLDALYRAGNGDGIREGHAAVPIDIDRETPGVSVLLPAVARGSGHRAVVQRRAKAGRNIHRHLEILHTEIGEDEFDLVEDARVQRD